MNFYNLYAVRSVFSYRNLKIEMMLHVCCFIFLLAHVDLIVSLEHASSTHFECISVLSLKLVRRHFSIKIRSSLLLSIGVLNDCLYGSQPSLHKEISEIINKTLIRMNFQWTSFLETVKKLHFVSCHHRSWPSSSREVQQTVLSWKVSFRSLKCGFECEQFWLHENHHHFLCCSRRQTQGQNNLLHKIGLHWQRYEECVIFSC